MENSHKPQSLTIFYCLPKLSNLIEPKIEDPLKMGAIFPDRTWTKNQKHYCRYNIQTRRQNEDKCPFLVGVLKEGAKHNFLLNWKDASLTQLPRTLTMVGTRILVNKLMMLPRDTTVPVKAGAMLIIAVKIPGMNPAQKIP